MDFHKIFRICLTQEEQELIRFQTESGNTCCHGNTFKTFSFEISFSIDLYLLAGVTACGSWLFFCSTKTLLFVLGNHLLLFQGMQKHCFFQKHPLTSMSVCTGGSAEKLVNRLLFIQGTLCFCSAKASSSFYIRFYRRQC